MNDAPRTAGLFRELAIILAAFGTALLVVPPVVAGAAYMSRQAMFWPALQALYSYFFRYTLLGAAGVAFLVGITRLIVRRWKIHASRRDDITDT